MKELRTEIEIEASPQAVWEILMDFGSYPEWNPFIVALAGTAELGEQLEVSMQPPGGRSMKFRPKVTVLEPTTRLQWLGKLGIKGVFDGRHQFTIEPTSDGTRFVQSEVFTGILVPLLSRSLDGATRRGFEAMNTALKERAERQSAGRG